MRTFIVAELGSNCHPFTERKLLHLLDGACLARADAVKIQLFRADHFPNIERNEKAKYVFPRDKLGWFIRKAREVFGLKVGASVFDKDAVDLVSDHGLEFIKLATREEHNHGLRDYVQETFYGSIFRSVDYPPTYPVTRFPREITLGCIPDYPTKPRRGHWGFLHDMHTHLPEPWGWSSHSLCIEDCLYAVMKGARVIEKHLYYSENDPEYRWSLAPTPFRSMTFLIRAYEYARTLRRLEELER